MRQRRVPWGRRTLGLFVVVWLNMALQPCSMAFGGEDDHDCLHCPPTHSEAGSSHSGHEADQSNPGKAPCEPDASQCAFLDDFKYDGRTIKVKVEDTPGNLPVGIVSSIGCDAFKDNLLQHSRIGEYSYVPACRTSLTVLYGVYLI